MKTEHYECARCSISSKTESRMIPCPRDGCEAILKGHYETSNVFTPLPEEDSKLNDPYYIEGYTYKLQTRGSGSFSGGVMITYTEI